MHPPILFPGHPSLDTPERECVGNEGLTCPFHQRYTTPPALDCLNDYIGGGSHYWHLACPECKREFVFDTYRFTLEPYQ